MASKLSQMANNTTVWTKRQDGTFAVYVPSRGVTFTVYADCTATAKRSEPDPLNYGRYDLRGEALSWAADMVGRIHRWNSAQGQYKGHQIVKTASGVATRYCIMTKGGRLLTTLGYRSKAKAKEAINAIIARGA
jgi:hypothetical protein